MYNSKTAGDQGYWEAVCKIQAITPIGLMNGFPLPVLTLPDCFDQGKPSATVKIIYTP